MRLLYWLITIKKRALRNFTDKAKVKMFARCHRSRFYNDDIDGFNWIEDVEQTMTTGNRRTLFDGKEERTQHKAMTKRQNSRSKRMKSKRIDVAIRISFRIYICQWQSWTSIGFVLEAAWGEWTENTLAFREYNNNIFMSFANDQAIRRDGIGIRTHTERRDVMYNQQ